MKSRNRIESGAVELALKNGSWSIVLLLLWVALPSVVDLQGGLQGGYGHLSHPSNLAKPRSESREKEAVFSCIFFLGLRKKKKKEKKTFRYNPEDKKNSDTLYSLPLFQIHFTATYFSH